MVTMIPFMGVFGILGLLIILSEVYIVTTDFRNVALWEYIGGIFLPLACLWPGVVCFLGEEFAFDGSWRFWILGSLISWILTAVLAFVSQSTSFLGYRNIRRRLIRSRFEIGS